MIDKQEILGAVTEAISAYTAYQKAQEREQAVRSERPLNPNGERFPSLDEYLAARDTYDGWNRRLVEAHAATSTAEAHYKRLVCEAGKYLALSPGDLARFRMPDGQDVLIACNDDRSHSLQLFHGNK